MKQLTEGQSFFLNAVRFVAAAMVVQFHNLSFLFNVSGTSHLTLRYIPHLGFVGVSIFFILSGFVIAYTVSRKTSGTGSYTLKIYLTERFSRIYIVLVPAVVIVVLTDIFLEKRYFPTLETHTAPANIFATLFLVNSFTPFGSSTGIAPVILGLEPVWSLAFEVCFYVLFGLIVLSSGSRWHRAAKIFAIAATLLFLSRLPYAPIMSYNWLLGCVGAHLFTRGIVLRPFARLGIIGLVLLAAAGILALTGERTLAQRQWIYISLLAAAFHALFVAFGTLAISPRLSAIAKFLASYSYSMYLLHYVLLDVAYNIMFDIRAIRARGPVLTTVFVILPFVAVNAVCYLFSLATERHTARLRKWLLGAQGAAGVAT